MWHWKYLVLLPKKRKESIVRKTEDHSINANTHIECLNSLDMFGDTGWGFGLDSSLWGYISGPLHSGRRLCGEWLRRGQVKPVSPMRWCRRFAPSREGAGCERGRHGKSFFFFFLSCRPSQPTEPLLFFLLFMQAPIKPVYRNISAPQLTATAPQASLL